MASRERERKLARAKLERQKARRAARERARRQTTGRVFAGVATLAVLTVLFFIFGGGNLFKAKKHEAAAGTTTCLWAPSSPPTASPAATSVGQPPADKIPTVGTDTMTINFAAGGTVTVALDRANASCAVASMKYLADSNYLNGTHCWRLQNADRQYFLQCGDKVGDGTGNPGYTFADENLPTGFDPPSASPSASGSPSASPSDDSAVPTEVVYPAGTVAMANTNNTNGSQFIIVFKDTVLPPAYGVIGTVTNGLDVITQMAANGVTAPTGADKITKPKAAVTADTITVTEDIPGAASTPSVAPSTSSSN